MVRWNNLLKRGGRVFTIAPLRPDSDAELVGFIREEASELHNAVYQAAQREAEKIDENNTLRVHC